MKKQRQKLEKELAMLFSNLENKTTKQDYYRQIEDKYNIPIDISSDIISMRRYISEYNEFILYAITDIVYPDKISEYFTDRELSMYEGQKYKKTTIAPVIELQMFRVTDDQWIGVSDAQWMMQLREAQMINYNADTQRALTIMLNGGKEIGVPTVNGNAVNAIADLYSHGLFIPNTLSLNIDADNVDVELIYDEEHHKLIIKNLNMFDIFDGYHRYLGMAKNYDKDHTFNYPTELRITNFSITKAKQFIYQEDQKTPMKKVDSETYNMQNPSNIVIEKLNSDTTFDLCNNINLKNGLINTGSLSVALTQYYFPKTRKHDRKEIIKYTKEIKNGLNEFIEEYDYYLSNIWQKYEIWMIVYGISSGHSSEEIYNALHNLSEEDIDKIQSTPKILKKQREIIKEAFGDE